jgi:iron complex outermembrane receptor protein
LKFNSSVKKDSSKKSPFLSLWLFIFITLWPVRGVAVEMIDVYKMDYSRLMHSNLLVTSPSKKPQKLHEASSAIYVITQEDIRRSGATNMPEALRLAPGLLVSKVNQNEYTVSSRGFNQVFGSNKLLVLIDGRTIYSPFFSGVSWIAQDTMLEDIDRIEIIRGPGASLWGSNAVAGVINIITKSADETQGTLVAGGTGTEEHGFAAVRYGGKTQNGLNYRFYGKYRDRDDGISGDGSPAFDEKQTVQGGFRSDWNINSKNNLTFQGDYYEFKSEDDLTARLKSFEFPFVGPFRTESERVGYNSIVRWQRKMDDKSLLTVQGFFDRAKIYSNEPLDIRIDTIDLDIQYDFKPLKNHKSAVGFNYRNINFDISESPAFRFPKEHTDLFGVFVHDEVTLIPKKWSVIMGSKFEVNPFTGLEIQPTIRTLWKPRKKHSMWAAFSRAVRTPSFFEDKNDTDSFPGFVEGVPALVRILGTADNKAENVLSYEFGYRWQAEQNLYFDFTTYLNQYDNIIDRVQKSVFFETSPSPPHFVAPQFFENVSTAEVVGAELSAEWVPISALQITGSYSLNKISISPFKPIAFLQESEEDEPQHLFNVRSYLKLPRGFSFDTFLYYVSENGARDVGAYTRMDIRLGWKPTKQVDISFMARNLLDPQHPEFNSQRQFVSETQRDFYTKATVRF